MFIMITKLLFIILLLSFLEQPAAGGPCILDLDISIVQVLWDAGPDAEIGSRYDITRLSDQKMIQSNITPTGTWLTVPAPQGSNCENHNAPTGYNKTVWALQNYAFDNCGGEFKIYTYGWEIDTDNANDIMWSITGQFKCDGKEFKQRDCQLSSSNGGGGGEVRITCTSLWSIDFLFPAFIKYLKDSLQNQNYNNLYQKYQELIGQLRLGDLGYNSQLDDCGKSNNWLKFESCKVFFFQPIIGVMASFRNQGSPIDNPTEIDKWIGPQFLIREEWKQRTTSKDMIELMKLVFSSNQKDDKLFASEMLYTMLQRANPVDFPWKDSPLGQRAELWYQYAKTANDAKIRDIFNLKVDQQVKDYCNAEIQKTLLCSILAAKNKYEGTLRYLPQNNPFSPISISAYVGADGLYKSFKTNLDILLLQSSIIGSVTQLSGGISGYFKTMANFDNAIAKSDAGYLTSNIEKNTKRLEIDGGRLDKLKEELDVLRRECSTLNIVESSLSLAAAIAIGVASGGAGIAAGAAGLPKMAEAFKTAYKTAEITRLTMEQMRTLGDKALEFKANALAGADVQRTTGAVKDDLTRIVTKLVQNSEKIDNIKMIQKAILDKTDFNSIQKEVDKFLDSNDDYAPAVEPTDLAELNTKQEQMLESFEKAFAGGFLCKMFVGGKATTTFQQARAIWASIYALLTDIHGKQGELVGALVKVVRSRLAEAAAIKFLEPGVNFNFEIIVGHMLSLRVAAQQVCDTFQFLNNDMPDVECMNIRNNIFLSEMARDQIEKVDKQLQDRLLFYPIQSRYAYIPVTTGTSTRAINWDDLISGKITEFQLSASDMMSEDYKWIDYPDQIALLKSLQIFIPNDLVPNANNERSIRFQINAIQDNIVVNGNPRAQRYTVKSGEPFSTSTTYTVNAQICPADAELRDDLFVRTNSKYCITKESGQFGNNLKRPLPVSAYSKFQVQLKNGYDQSSLPFLQAIRPVGNTLKLRARLVYFLNSGGGKMTVSSASSETSIPPNTEPCPPGLYRLNWQDCAPCPPASVPYAQGAYCISQEAANMIAGMGIASAGSFEAKQFASASDKETVITEPIKAKTKPSLFQRFKNWIG